MFCNGQSDEAKACDVVNKGKDRNQVNPFQTFYCKNECGRWMSDDDLPYCDVTGRVCAADEGCTTLCDGICYSPSSQGDTIFGGSTETGYRQCLNIASSEVAMESLRHAQGAFFASIVIGQIAGLMVCKTRWLSIRVQGMKNSVMLFGIGTEILLVAFLAYCVPLNALGTRPLRLVHFFCAIPFALIIFLYDESRKAVMRATSPETTNVVTGQVSRKAGWLERNTYY